MEIGWNKIKELVSEFDDLYDQQKKWVENQLPNFKEGHLLRESLLSLKLETAEQALRSSLEYRKNRFLSLQKFIEEIKDPQ